MTAEDDVVQVVEVTEPVVAAVVDRQSPYSLIGFDLDTTGKRLIDEVKLNMGGFSRSNLITDIH